MFHIPPPPQQRCAPPPPHPLMGRFLAGYSLITLITAALLAFVGR